MAEEITVNSMYDISMRGITNANLPLFKGVDREVCIINGMLVNGHTITIG